MKKLTGVVVSAKMEKTAVVEVLTYRPHPLYKKLMRVTRRFKADTTDVQPASGDRVVMVETRPLSKGKHFKVAEILKGGTK